jgi:hypothetical protein
MKTGGRKTRREEKGRGHEPLMMALMVAFGG